MSGVRRQWERLCRGIHAARGTRMTYLHAAVTILTYADRPLTIGELTATAVAYGLVHPRGRTPDRSMSSILYRRMAADPDAPVTAMDGRFWLRGRPLPDQTAPA